VLQPVLQTALPPAPAGPATLRAALRRAALLLGVAVALPGVLVPLQSAQAQAAPAAAPPFSTELAIQTFDSVWNRVAHTHYDPDFGGVDWEAVREELEPRAAAASSNTELRGVLTEMVGRLGLSHFAIFGPETGAALEEMGGAGPGSGAGLAAPGLDLRLVEGVVTVLRVTPGSPADRAGVRPGWQLLEVDGVDPSVLPEGALEALASGGPDVGEERLRALYLPSIALARLQGSEGSLVEVVFMDGEDRRRALALDRAPPPGEVVRFGYLPPIPVSVEDRALPLPGSQGEGAAWIHLSAWFPAATPLLAQAVDRHRQREGLVLDLRGNPGGVAGMAMGVAGHFVDERLSLGTMRTREATLHFNTSPQRISADGVRVDPFGGPLAILVDPLSASTSEIFAAGMQALGRARVFGEVTAGQALPAAIVALPNGDRFMHVIADYSAPGDLRLEGRGVVPDEVTPPTRAALLAGRDPALDRALQWLSDSREP
jgi:carboxyl-terminal processing protease